MWSVKMNRRKLVFLFLSYTVYQRLHNPSFFLENTFTQEFMRNKFTEKSNHKSNVKLTMEYFAQ